MQLTVRVDTPTILARTDFIKKMKENRRLEKESTQSNADIAIRTHGQSMLVAQVERQFSRASTSLLPHRFSELMRSSGNPLEDVAALVV